MSERKRHSKLDIPIFEGAWDSAFASAERELGFTVMTKSQLSKAGYQTGKKLPKPCACMYYSKSADGYLYVYNPADAVPKRKPTTKERERLDKAREKAMQRYYCNLCNCKLESHERGHTYCDRCAMVVWAEGVLERGAFILDSETTGLNTQKDEPVEIAIIDTDGYCHFDMRIKPRDIKRLYHKNNRGISAYDIHGIGYEELATAPTLYDVHQRLYEILNAHPVLIYNYSYDAQLIDYSLSARGLPMLFHSENDEEWPRKQDDCVMKRYAQFVGETRSTGRRWYEWEYRWQRLPGGDHSALGDARATLRVIERMAEGKNVAYG